MKFLIPSYNRPERQRTIEYLTGMGYSKKEIVVATQTEKDYAAYSEKYGEQATILYKAADNVSKNRNTLLDGAKVGERLIMLDDDIRCLQKLDYIATAKKPWKYIHNIETRSEFETVIRTAFTLCEKAGASLWGIFYNNNVLEMQQSIAKNGIVSKDRMSIGDVMGMLFTGQRFDERYDSKEDYEYSLRQIRAGKPVLRLNNVANNTTVRAKGGCREIWDSAERKLYSAALLECEYPEYIKMNPRKPGEVLQKKGTVRK